MKRSFKTLMFHGVADRLSEHCVFPPSKNCFVRTEDFEKAIAYCAQRFKILRPADLAGYFDGTAPEDGIFITVDDGLQHFFDHGVPILKKCNATATVFLTSDWTNEGIEPAVFSLEYHLFNQLPAKLEVTRNDFYFKREVGNKKAINAALTDLWNLLFEKKIPANSIRSNEILLNGVKMGGLNDDGNPGYWKPASWETVRKAHEEGTIDIGGHGKTHSPFSWLDANELEQEFTANNEEIKRQLGTDVALCTFPHGMYNTSALRIVGKYYRYGFTNKVIPPAAETRTCISRYNVPYQRPNSIPSLLSYPLAGRLLRKAGAVSGLF